MTIEQLIEGLDLRVVAGSSKHPIADLTDDSRAVNPRSLFIARGGAKFDGRAFIQDAISRGATAIVTDLPPVDRPSNAESVTWILSPRVDQALSSHLAERFWNHPARQLKLIGITGTNGKTTTAFLIQHLLRQAGVRCGMIGTIWTDDGHNKIPSPLTTPGPIGFSRALAAMVQSGCTAAVAEISSHALHQGRVAAMEFDAAVFTNLTGDHLDYHNTVDHYAASKAKLFQKLKPHGRAIINVDDAYADRMIAGLESRAASTADHLLRCTLTPGEPSPGTCRALIRNLAADHSQVCFQGPWGTFDARVPLVGRYNVANTLQAIAAATAVAALDPRQLQPAVQHAPAVPGRLQPIQRPSGAADSLPIVLVDYAHTHDALQNALDAVRPLVSGELAVIFGCGGDRDQTKRPKMAQVACHLADRVYITSDNPRTEDPNAIIQQILAGVPEHARHRVHVDPDRAAAIAAAITRAAPGDVVLIAGKGHEDYQIIGTTKHHFDDREQAVKILTDQARRRSQPQINT